MAVYRVEGLPDDPLAAGLTLLTPLYFTVSLWGAARLASDRLALAFGVVTWPAMHWLEPNFELIWTGLIFASLRLINPTLASAIDWPWFVLCQVAFGAVCGFVVFKSTKVETMQNWSLAEKLGVEAQHETEDEK